MTRRTDTPLGERGYNASAPSWFLAAFLLTLAILSAVVFGFLAYAAAIGGYPLIASIFALQASFSALGVGLMGRHGG